nr:HAD family hydrolase [Cupriavidus sp. D39]
MQPYSVADESALILLGYIAFIDPPKDSAAPALAALRDSGIEVKVLTGDSPVIARKICREVGLDVDRAVLGAELDGLSPQELGNSRSARSCSPSWRRRTRRPSSRPCGHADGWWAYWAMASTTGPR